MQISFQFAIFLSPDLIAVCAASYQNEKNAQDLNYDIFAMTNFDKFKNFKNL